MSRSEAIEAFLTTGIAPSDWAAWGDDRDQGEAMLRRVLVRVVAHRCEGAPLQHRMPEVDPAEVVLERVRPMLAGLLPADEAEALSHLLRDRVCVVTPESYASDIRLLSLEDSWTLANVLLEDLGAPPISDDTPHLDGLCAAGRAWVPPGGLRPATPTTDVVVHEVAHLLHTLTRADLGLDRSRTPLLPVPACDFESFAYACELWSCSGEAGVSGETIEEAMRVARLMDVRVDHDRLAAALAGATRAGWPGLAAAILDERIAASA